MQLSFYIPTEIIMDDNCVVKHAEKLKKLGKRALIVTGTRSAKENGSLSDLCEALSTNGQSWALFDKVMSNPTVDCVYEGAEMAKQEGADFVVALGGGSPMDAAKAIALLALQDIPRENIFGGGYERRLPLCCIPTTAGTGSEVTQYAILTNEAAQTKTSLASPALFPDIAMLDSKYLSYAPRKTMVNTVIDSLSHSVEGFLSVRANALSDALALEAIRIIGKITGRLAAWTITDDDKAQLLYASTLGGMVIAHTGTTAVHSMGYSLTFFKDVDHGRANGLLLPEFLKYTEKERPDRIAPIINAMGLESTGDFALVLDKLLGEREEITESEVEKYSAIAIKAKNIPNCVIKPSEEDIQKLYRRAFGL